MVGCQIATLHWQDFWLHPCKKGLHFFIALIMACYARDIAWHMHKHTYIHCILRWSRISLSGSYLSLTGSEIPMIYPLHDYIYHVYWVNIDDCSKRVPRQLTNCTSSGREFGIFHLIGDSRYLDSIFMGGLTATLIMEHVPLGPTTPSLMGPYWPFLSPLRGPN